MASLLPLITVHSSLVPAFIFNASPSAWGIVVTLCPLFVIITVVFIPLPPVVFKLVFSLGDMCFVELSFLHIVIKHLAITQLSFMAVLAKYQFPKSWALHFHIKLGGYHYRTICRAGDSLAFDFFSA